MTPRARALAIAPWVVAVLALAAAAWAWKQRALRLGTSWDYVTFGDAFVPGTGVSSLALSPDGSMLAVRDPAQNGRIWIKRRGDLHAVVVPGTERGFLPAFSPDGQWILFQADGKLKKVRPGEGGAITLSDSTYSTLSLGGGAWLDDGTVVYTGPSFSQLSRVSAAGGQSTVVMSDSVLAGFGIGNPKALPGARGVLFTACNAACVGMSIHVLDLRTGRQHQLVDDAATGWYLSTGHLLYVRRNGVALVAPFDLDKLAISGPGVQMLDGVLVNAGAAFLTVSQSGTLVYLQGSATANELDVVRVTREGIATPVDSSWHGPFNSLAASPDGRRIAIGVGLASGTLGIWIKQLDRGPFTRLTFGGQDRRPAWSPDGQTVAFIRDSLATSIVFARRADGSTPDRLLAWLDRQVQEVAWSPDGHWLLLRTDNGSAGTGDIVGLRTSGDTTPVPLVSSPFTELHPALSHDGRWLAYTSIESGTNEVYVRPFPGTTGGRWQVSNGGGSQPCWSSDGSELYYLDPNNRMIAAQIRHGPTFEVSDLKPLFDASPFTIDFFHLSYGVPPGGRGFVFLRPRQSGRLAAPILVRAENWFADIRARMTH